MLPYNITLQNRYQIIEQIGRGGMGAVYKAIDTRLQATVALKQTMVEGEPLRKAFEREAQMLASMHHPILPHVSDHFIEEQGQFLVMEYIPGTDLGTLIQDRNRPFPIDDVLRWADQLLDALDYLHTRTPAIIHRDIKPQNLKLTERNEVVLLDFGLAKGGAAQTRVTSTGSIFGYTPHYAPLEQIHGTGTDGRSDLYALAATLYHLLTTVVPVDAMTRAAAKVNDEPDPLVPIDQVNPSIPPAIAAVLHQALSQRAIQRPDSAAAMRALLREAAGTIAQSAFSIPTQFDGPPANTTIARTLPQLSGTALRAQVLGDTNTNPPPQTRAQRLGVWAALGAAALLLVAVVSVFALRATATNSPLPTPTQEPIAVVVAPTVATATPTLAPTQDVVKAALATFTVQTSTAQSFAGLVGTAGGQTVAALASPTQPSIALTSTSQPLPTAAVAAASTPTTAPAPTIAPTAIAVVEPPPTPTRPPATKAPDTPTPAPQACAISTVRGFDKVLQDNPKIRQQLGCPQQSEAGSEGTEQPFEHGSMIWFKQSDRFYILTGSTSGQWFGLSGADIQDKPPIPEEVPAGFYAPGAPQDFREDDGFARVWSNYKRARALGWGTNVEAYFPDGAYQVFDHGVMIFTPSGLGNGKMIWVLFADGGFARYRDTFVG